MSQEKHESLSSVNPAASEKLARVVAEAANELYTKARAGFLSGAPKIEARLRALDIKAPDAEHIADDLSRKLAKAIALAEEMKRHDEAPFSRGLEMVRTRWRDVLTRLTEVRGLAGAKRADALAHKRDVEDRERRAREEALAAARKAEQDATDAEQKQAALANLRTARVAIDELPPPGAPVAIRSADGGVTAPRKDWTWEIATPGPVRFEVKKSNKEHDAGAWWTVVDVQEEGAAIAMSPMKPAADLIALTLNAETSNVPREFLQLDRGAITKAVKGGRRDIPGLRIFERKSMVER